MNSVEEIVIDLMDELNKNPKFSKEQSISLLADLLVTIVKNNVPSEQRYGAAMTAADYIKRAKSGNIKVARGFFGNWAKWFHDNR